MSWPAVRSALNTRLSTLPGIDWTKVALPNVIFPAQTSRYWKVAILPSGADPELGGNDHERGIYQVSIFVPAGSGITSGLTDAQAVVDWFKRQTFSGVSCGVPTLAPPIQEADWFHIPVSVPFQTL